MKGFYLAGELHLLFPNGGHVSTLKEGTKAEPVVPEYVRSTYGMGRRFEIREIPSWLLYLWAVLLQGKHCHHLPQTEKNLSHHKRRAVCRTFRGEKPNPYGLWKNYLSSIGWRLMQKAFLAMPFGKGSFRRCIVKKRLPAEKNPAGRRQQDFCITILFDAYGMMATFMTPSRFSSNNSYASLILSNG